MSPEAIRHPRTVVALAITRTRGEYARNSTIRSTALFTVTLSEEGPAFRLDHRAYRRSVLRADIISELSNAIPRATSLVTAVPNHPRGHFRRLLMKGDPLPPADIQLIQRARPDLDILPLKVGRRALEAAASDLAIPLADIDAPVSQRARRAGDHAQAIWAAYLSLCAPADRINLRSAWQAWTALQRARPLPF